jgi:hypothetical protein
MALLRGVGGIFRRTREAKTYLIISKSAVIFDRPKLKYHHISSQLISEVDDV